MTNANRFVAALAAAVAAAFAHPALAAQPQPWAIGFQPAATPAMQRIESLAGFINVVIVAVVVLVTALVAWVVWRYNARRNPIPATWSHNTKLEIAWTAIPALILLVIAVPSFRLLYFEARTPKPDMTVKVIGHQWYWSYQYAGTAAAGGGPLAFDSMLVDAADLKPGQPRLLTADHPLVLPVGATVRLLITSSDVIHSWSVPAFGVKTDAIPGRVNETWVKILKPGVYYGQCSQLCGIDHGFMPIMVRAVPKVQFHAWLARERVHLARAD